MQTKKPEGVTAVPPRFHASRGGHPSQNELLTGRAIFTDAYAFFPHGVMRDIVTSALPGWEKTRAWVLARPMTGFAETFSQFLMEVEPGGGSETPEPDSQAEAALFCLEGDMVLTIAGERFELKEGSFAYCPPGSAWTLRAEGDRFARFYWIRKSYESAPGYGVPDPIVVPDEAEIEPVPMLDTDGAWATTRFMDPADMRHDMAMTIVTLQPGAVIPFLETHVMEHGLTVLQGKGVYRLNADWVEVEAGDFMWLRAFCPQACYAGGPGPFRYLLYKDVNRFPALRLGAR